MCGPLLAVSRTEINRITFLELQGTERELATIDVSNQQPFGLAFDESSQWVYLACWNSAKITAINMRTLEEENSFEAPSLPAWASRRDGTHEIWISNEGAGVVTILDTRTRRISGEIATGNGPSDIAFTGSGAYAWVTNERDGTVALIDATARKKIRDIRVGEVPQGIAVACSGAELLVANFGSDTVSLIDTRRAEEIVQISVGKGPVDVVTLRRASIEHAWVSCFSEGTISVVNVGRNEEIQRIEVGGRPQGLEIHPDGSRLYVAVRDLNQLIVATTLWPCSILRRIMMEGGPARMAIAPMPRVRTGFPAH
jgi:YVTN family beta-propeller protein